MTGRLAITLLLCFEQLSTLFSLLHFFFFPNTFSCKHLFFPNTSNILSTCSHSLLSLSFSQILTMFWPFCFPRIHSLFSHSVLFFYFFLHFTLFFTLSFFCLYLYPPIISFLFFFFYYLSP